MISELVPIALGVALSPAPVLAVGVMLLAHRASAAGLGFTAGWVVALGALTGLAAAVSGAVSTSSGLARASYPIQVAFGAALLGIAARQWFTRPDADAEAVAPKWMASAAAFGPGRAAVLGVVLVVANPKVVPLCLAAGREIGSTSAVRAATSEVVAFTLVAASTVIIPVCAQLVAGPRMRPGLQSMEAWLVAHYTSVVCFTLVVVGAVLIVTGARGI